jgi:hypothetical protein
MRILQLISIFVLIALYTLVKIPGAVLLLKPYGIDLYRLGDLYRHSYLSEYRDTTEVYPHSPVKSESNTHLYVLGDSFTGSFSKEHYTGVKQYSFANWNQFADHSITIKTDSSVSNILLVACSEKNIRLRFAKNQMGIYLAKSSPKGKPGFQISEHPSTSAEQIKKYLGRPEVSDQNIQAVLLSNEFALRIKEFKAQFNYEVFGKIASEVEEYKPKNMLFQRLTTDPKYLYMSSFRPLETSEEDDLINSMKRMVNHYKRAGIDSVVLAFIPNPVSVIVPNYKGQQYNQLIPKLENRINETGAACISIFNEFSAGREMFYRRGDTHWNVRGAVLWLDKVNKLN